MPWSSAQFRAICALVACALWLGACVIGRPARQSQPESAEGPSGAPVTGSPVVPQTAPPDGDDAPPAQSKPGFVWVRGYWHWDGVRHVWERGRWEAAAVTAP